MHSSSTPRCRRDLGFSDQLSQLVVRGSSEVSVERFAIASPEYAALANIITR